MPTYEYACPSCGHRFDIWQEVGSPAPACEKCESATKKVFQPPRVIFKGSGFYLTDKRAEQGVSDKAEAPPASTESSAPKTESKSENTGSAAPSGSTSGGDAASKSAPPKAS